MNSMIKEQKEGWIKTLGGGLSQDTYLYCCSVMVVASTNKGQKGPWGYGLVLLLAEISVHFPEAEQVRPGMGQIQTYAAVRTQTQRTLRTRLHSFIEWATRERLKSCEAVQVY